MIYYYAFTVPGASKMYIVHVLGYDTSTEQWQDCNWTTSHKDTTYMWQCSRLILWGKYSFLVVKLFSLHTRFACLSFLAHEAKYVFTIWFATLTLFSRAVPRLSRCPRVSFRSLTMQELIHHYVLITWYNRQLMMTWYIGQLVDLTCPY